VELEFSENIYIYRVSEHSDLISAILTLLARFSEKGWGRSARTADAIVDIAIELEERIGIKVWFGRNDEEEYPALVFDTKGMYARLELAPKKYILFRGVAGGLKEVLRVGFDEAR